MPSLILTVSGRLQMCSYFGFNARVLDGGHALLEHGWIFIINYCYRAVADMDSVDWGICLGFYRSLYRTTTISYRQTIYRKEIVGSTLYSSALNVLGSRAVLLCFHLFVSLACAFALCACLVKGLCCCRLVGKGQALYEGWMTEGPASTWSSLTDSVLVIIM